MAWVVENKHWYRGKEEPANAVYIARPKAGEPVSVLANPFVAKGKVSKHNVIAVRDPILAYRKLLFVYVQTDCPVRREIDRLARMDDGILLCWCAPNPCHGHVLVRCIEWFREHFLAEPYEWYFRDCPDSWKDFRMFHVVA